MDKLDVGSAANIYEVWYDGDRKRNLLDSDRKIC
jgi:hypothetical protein